MKKKLMALFLALSMAVSLVTPAFAAGGMVTSPSEVLASTPAGRAALLSAWDFEVFQKDDLDKAVEEATVNLFEKTQIMLGELDIPGVDFQWQIAVPDQDLWVDIQGEDKLGLDLSYAKVASLLNEDGEAQVRCEVSLGSLVFQGPIITVDVDEDAKPESEPVEEKEPVVLKGPEVVIHDSQPAEPEEPEAEEPASESPAPEAPVVPPAQQEPVVEPEVVPEVETEDPATELDRSALDESVVAVYNHRAAPLTASTNLIVADVEDEEEVEVAEPCTVVINYVFADGDQAANPWTATVPVGTILNRTVKSPAVLGYTPDQLEIVFGGEEEDAIIEDTEYFVTYSPATVNFTVKHLRQNLEDDKYSLIDSKNDVVTTSGYTDSPVGDGLEKTYEGFYDLLYDETTKIAADGSTEVEIYYDRYYYLMNFDLNGGYGDGVEPIYARYGAAVEAGTPTRPGYTFTGWKDVATETVYQVDKFPYATMPAKNTEFVAQWTSGNTTYDVVFWYENADDDGYSQAGVLNDVSATAGETVNGSTFQDTNFEGRDADHFTYEDADSNVVVKGDGSTVVNVYFSRNVYTLTFKMSTTGCTAELHSHVDACKELVCDRAVHDHAAHGCAMSCNHQSHDIDCYSAEYGRWLEEIEKPSDNLTSEGNGIYSYKVNYSGYTQYTLNVEGKWYESSRGGWDKINISCSHTHDDSCYTCGVTGHVHNESCYTITCGKYEHYHSGNTCYLIVKEKYDADISGVWLNNPVKAILDSGDAFTWSETDAQVSFMEKMPGVDSTMTQYDYSGSNKYHWFYYLEVLPGQSTDGLTIKTTADGKTYYEYDDSVVYSSDLTLTYDDDYYPITGFDQLYDKGEGGWDYSSRYGCYTHSLAYNKSADEYQAFLYYTRNSYELTFSNYGTPVADKGGTFLYEADISGENFTPDYPSTLEANAYVFDGWYTSPYFGDTKFNFTTTDGDGNTVKATMPANDLTLYAHWVPVNHNVKIFLTSDMDDQIGDTQVVAHRGYATAPADPTNGEYVFAGWFYKDNGVEKAFNFSMPITKDMNIYAKWSSNKLMPYTIHYQLADGTTVAPSTEGYALAGTTKTFEAKAGDELNKDYQSGYYPHTNSHSIVIDIKDPSKNEFIFVYHPATKLSYKVMYLLDDGNGVYNGGETVLHTEKNAETAKAIITEKFEPITGYRPDAYQKRLILSADQTENVIIFWYTVDKEHAPIQVVHYIQNAEGNGYTEYQSSTELNGVIGAPYSEEILTIPGYGFDHATANGTAVTRDDDKVTGTVAENGLLLELYYNRNLYSYEFRFLEQGTDNVLADAVTGEARYGSQVTQRAKSIPGYICVSDEAQAITIQKEETNNVRTFYYVEAATINYKMIGPSGAISDELEESYGAITRGTETVKVLTEEDPKGSIASVKSNDYRFAGWFDEDGVKLSDELSFVPEKVDGKNVAATYYAKFAYNLTSLTIDKNAAEGTSIDRNQTFLFEVTDSKNNKVADVVITGDGQTTISGLTVGETYTVTEKTDWSWRYTPTGGATKTTAPLSATAAKNTVTFENSKSENGNKWLSGVCYAVNNWMASKLEGN